MNLALSSPLDMHLHLREGGLLARVAPLSAAHFAGAVVMPNLVRPVDDASTLRAYRAAVRQACGDGVFEPYMTLFFRDYDRATLEALRGEILGVKLYPAGITTQSEGGVRDLDRIEPTAALLEDLGIPLLVHGETHGFVLDREREFLPVIRRLAKTFPRLHLVLEHITTAEAVELLCDHENLSATVTLHHLLITLDDVAGGALRPHLFCKPIAKTPRDRDALRAAVFGGHPRIVFGSDSAPHPRDRKECCGCAAGVFTAPVALPLLVQLFEEAGCLDRVQPFVSDHARVRYGVTPPAKTVHLERRPWQVPQTYGEVRPFHAGRTLAWSVTEVTT